jgi:DNA helicase II / ATP-dependent DNA helicase PcrA
LSNNSSNFSKLPFEAEWSTIPKATTVDGGTSIKLVNKDEEDAAFFRNIEKAGIYLNGPQIDAVRHVNGPCLTLAGAGTGKTTVLVCRTGYLMTVKNIQPNNILLVTFTRKAAEEMKERIAKLPTMNGNKAKAIQASTFHSLFLMLLRGQKYTQEIIGNERYKQIILKQIQRQMNINDPFDAETLLSTLSYYKLNKIELAVQPNDSRTEKQIKRILLQYEEWKRKNHKLDFDDILCEAYLLLKGNPSLLQSLQNRFRYVMVDEFQDTNFLQYELVKMIAGHKNLFVVGDDDQTIYSFNGARNEFILDFDTHYKDAKVITLVANYRSNPYIIGLGNEVISKNKSRRKKELSATYEGGFQPLYSRPATADEEADWIIKEIEQLHNDGYAYQDIAILHRTASSSRAIFEQLILKEMPFNPYNQKETLFYENWMIKPVVDYLRLVIVPRNFTAIESILPSMFINREKGMAHILNKEEEEGRKKYPLIHLTTIPSLKPFQVKSIKERLKFLKDLQKETPEVAIKKIRRSFYHKYMEAEESNLVTEQKEMINEMLNELEGSAKRFDSIASFINFIDEMKLKVQEVYQQSNQKKDAISLMTIHRSKGLEFKAVFVIGAIEGNLPHASALKADSLEDKVYAKADKNNKVTQAVEEERRLAYVAITRAKERLYISSPGFYQGDKRESSRFIANLFKKPAVRPDKNKEKKVLGQKVKAWICSSDNCIAWQRFESKEKGKEKQCPLCKEKMILGEKDL